MFVRRIERGAERREGQRGEGERNRKERERGREGKEEGGRERESTFGTFCRYCFDSRTPHYTSSYPGQVKSC